MIVLLLQSRNGGILLLLIFVSLMLTVIAASSGNASALTTIGSPTGLSATAISPSQVSLNWTAPSANGTAHVNDYEIERAHGNLSFGAFSNSTDRLFFSSGNKTTFTDSGLAPDTVYNYTVFAILSSPPSNSTSVNMPGAPPGTPTGLVAKATAFSKIRLDWAPPSNNGGLPITGYEVERTQGDISFSFTNSTNTIFFSYGNATSFTDSGLKPLTTYNYTVFAKNNVGTGQAASPAHATTPQELFITVLSNNTAGSQISESPIQLDSSKGILVDSGHTPVTFHVTYGAPYNVVTKNYGSYVFNHWENGSTNPTRAIAPTTNMTLTAFYDVENLPSFNMTAFLKTGSNAYQQDLQTLSSSLVRGDYLFIHGSKTEFPTTLQNVQAAKSEVQPGVNVGSAMFYAKIADLTSQVPTWPKGLDMVFYDYESGTSFSPEFTTDENQSIQYFDEAESSVRQYNTNTGGNAKLMVAPSYGDLRLANWDWGLAAKHTDMIDVQFGGYTNSSDLFKYATQVYSQIRQESPNTGTLIQLSLLPKMSTAQITSDDIYKLDSDGVEGFVPWYDESNTTQSVTLQQFFNLLPRSVPPPPANLTASASSSTISLSWSAPSGGTYDITGYKVERTSNGNAWSVLPWSTSSNTTSYSDTGLASNTAYTYRVSTMNKMGTGSPSGNASATTPVILTQPGAPTGLAASTISSSQVNLRWTPPSSNGGSPITGYEVERAQGDISFSFTNSTNAVFFSYGNATTFADSGLQPSTTYNYTVFAENKAGTGQAASPVLASTAVAPLGAPTGLTAKATTFSKIRLGWTPPSGNGGSPITGYEVERALGDLTYGFSNSTSTLFFSYGNATSFTDSGLKPLTTYNYTVFAKNNVGTGPAASPAHATTPQELFITVLSDNSTGIQISGIPIDLDSSTGVLVNSGHTPFTFHVTYGAQYNVVAKNYGSYVFNHWENGSTNPTRAIAPTTNMTLTAYYG